MRALILIGHGSRRSQGNQGVAELAKRLGELGDSVVRHGFIELAQPSAGQVIDQVVAQGARQVVLLPAVLLSAGHSKNDLPMVLSQARLRHPAVEFVGVPPLGVSVGVVTLHSAHLHALREGQAPVASHKVGLLLLGRGSSDPDANGQVYKLARLLAERQGLAGHEVGFVGVTQPTLEQAFVALMARRPRQILIVPHLLYTGVLLERVRAQAAALAALYPRVSVGVSQALGAHPALPELLLERVSQVDSGHVSACDACKYRAPMPGFEHEVGGAQAMRKAKAHLEIPADPEQPAHSHSPPRSHVLVCVNRDCVKRGSLATLDRLRQRVRADGKREQILTTRVMCMGRCGEGPAVCVYPDGVWYRGVDAQGADEIYEQHLLQNRPVGRLIDQVLGGV